MKTSLLAFAITAMLATTSCATTGGLAGFTSPVSSTTSQTQAAKPKADGKRLFKAGGIGCLAGALGGLFSGNKKAAIAGCVVGGAVGSISSYQAQMAEARHLAAEAQAAGMPAHVATKQVEAEGKPVEALDQLVIAYEPASMIARDAKTVAVLDKLAALAKKSKTPLTITAEGSNAKACQIPLAELSARGAFGPATAVDKCGAGKARLVISPVPDLT